MAVAVGALVVGAFTTSTVVAGIVGSAIIGAAVGGLTAAVTGGSIGKGMLFGAVGGAVMGGITGAMGGFSSAAGSTGAISGSMSENVALQAAKEGTKIATTEAVKTSAFEAGKFFSTQGGGVIGASLLTTAGTTIAGAFDDTAEQAAKLEREKMAQQDKQFYANLEAQKEIAGMSGGGGGGGGSDAVEVARINQETQREQLAEQRRQFEKEKSIVEASRERAAGALSGLVASKETGTIDPNAKSIDEQVYEESTQMYEDPTAVANKKPEGALAYA